MSANITSGEPANSEQILPDIWGKTSGTFGKMDISINNCHPPGGPELTMEDEIATTIFLENVNKWRAARELTEVN